MEMAVERAARAEAFAALHVAGRPLLLANAWDVASAIVVARAGAAAVGTTSAGVAWSLGWPDGDRLTRAEAVAAVARIAAAVDLPVSADIERGFGTDADGVAETVRGITAAGAVGVNLEDSVPGPDPLRPTAEQAERIVAARQAAGADLYLNARTDVFLRAVGEPPRRVDATVARAEAYLGAGASGIFVPGVTDLTTVAELTRRIAAPVNILVGPGAPTVGELADAGVARISYGSAGASAAYGLLARSARELFERGTYESLSGGLDYGQLNAALAATR